MPSNVARFEQLMYLSLGIGVIQSLLRWNQSVAQASAIGGAKFVFFGLIVTFAILVLIIWLIARRRRNWARWVMLVMFILGLPFSVRMLSRMLPAEPLSVALSSVQVLAQAIAFFLIFTGNARDWFKRVPAAI
jgi:hypothetical protein